MKPSVRKNSVEMKTALFFILPLIVCIAIANLEVKSQDIADTVHDVHYPAETGYELQEQKYDHFFNGSYSVHDVLEELLNNRSLILTAPRSDR